MGIPALWDIIKEQDNSELIAQLAQDHYKKHGRPLRIAVDEADWRFNNLTAQQVYIIRAKSNDSAFQGIERSMFYRICRLLTLNIQLLFVFDGPRRPHKRGRGGQGRIDYEKLRLLKDMLRHFRIPYHEAPGEAEAECARLQQLGVVDAVFSQDSDSLMFGSDFLIRDDRVSKEKGSNSRSKENTKKNASTVRVIRGQDIQEKHGLDREGLVLFAMLCGGDYDMKGLEKCGPAIALRAIQAGLAKSLCRCRTQADCLSWREELVDWIQTQRRYSGFVPFNYPDIKILNKYNRPTISSDEQLLNLRGLQGGWDKPLDELNLLELTSSRFNIWGTKYMNWVGPVLMTKFLAARDSRLPREHVHQIKLTKQRAKKNDNGQPVPPPLERKLTFSPFGLSTLQRKDFEGERAGYWTGVASEPFDPNYRVEWEMPAYLLEKVLPPEVLDPPPAPGKASGKRKRQADASADEFGMPTPTPKRKRTTPIATQQSGNRRVKLSRADSNSTPTQAVRTDVVEPIGSGVECISLLSDSDNDVSPTKRRLGSNFIDLGWELTDSEDEENEEQLSRAIQSSLQGAKHSTSTLSSCARRQHVDNTPWTDRRAGPSRPLNPTESPIRKETQAPLTITRSTPPPRAHPPFEQSLISKRPRNRHQAFAESPSRSLSSRLISESTSITAESHSTHWSSRTVPKTSDNLELMTAQPTTLNTDVLEPTNIAEIRAARLRYFDSLPSAQIEFRRETSLNHAGTKRSTEIELIDLTDL